MEFNDHLARNTAALRRLIMGIVQSASQTGVDAIAVAEPGGGAAIRAKVPSQGATPQTASLSLRDRDR